MTDSNQELEKAFEGTLSDLVRALKPERALVIYQPEGQQQLQIRARHGIRLDVELQEADISLSIVEKVFQEGGQLTCVDASVSGATAELEPTLSAVLGGLRSVVCAPITHPQGMRIGVLYADDRKVAGRFHEGNAAWMTAQGSVLGARIAAFTQQSDDQKTVDSEPWVKARQRGLSAKEPGRLGKSEKHLREALRGCREEGVTGLPLARALNDLGEVRRMRGDSQEAESLLYECLQVVNDSEHAGEPETIPFLNNLAGLLYRKGDRVAAEELYVRSLGLLRSEDRRHRRLAVPVLCNLGTLQAEKGDPETARSFFERANRIAMGLWGASDPRTLACQAKLRRFE